MIEMSRPVSSTHRRAAVAAVHCEEGAAGILQLLDEFERLVEVVEQADLAKEGTLSERDNVDTIVSSNLRST